MAREDGGPAFPLSWEHEGAVFNHAGMSLRDYFAGQALVSVLNDPDRVYGTAKKTGADAMELAGAIAYNFADAMLKARSTEK